MTGLTAPAITGIVKELVHLGFVKETGLGQSQGGRKPIQLEINAEAGYVLGLEVTHHEVTLGIANLKDDPVLLSRTKLDMSEPEAGIKHLVALVKSAISTEYNGKILAAGIAFPGLLDTTSGVVTRSINLGPHWDGYALRPELEKRLGMKVFIENNSNAAALAEQWYGDFSNCSDLVYINWGEGISAGIICGDRILQGHRGFAGEIGHIVMRPDGALCNCGNRGCLEAVAGIPALERKTTVELPFIREDDPIRLRAAAGPVSIEDIVECAGLEGSYCSELMRQAARYIGGAIANVVNILNPEVIFLGGKMTAAAALVQDEIREALQSNAFPEVATGTTVKISSLDGRAAFSGACALALREMLESAKSDIL